jgi:hypothetical protein
MTPDASMTPRHRTKSFPHKAGIALAVLLLTVSAGWLARVQILRGAARVWIVSDSLVPADAVAVLGGGLETRPFAAADPTMQTRTAGPVRVCGCHRPNGVAPAVAVCDTTDHRGRKPVEADACDGELLSSV